MSRGVPEGFLYFYGVGAVDTKEKMEAKEPLVIDDDSNKEIVLT